MTDQALDDLARRVLLDAARQEYSGLREALPGHVFSPAFERKMGKLLRRARHPVRYRLVQAAACLLLAALLSGCSVLAFVPEARAAFAGWLREFRQEWFSYHYAGEREIWLENRVYCPSWLPEGYREVTAPKLGTFVHAVYENGDGSRLSYSYQVILDAMTFHVEREGAHFRQVAVAGARADLYENTARGVNVLVWTDEDRGIVFWIAGELTEEELVRVAESIRASAPLDWVYRPTWFPDGSFFISSTEENGRGEYCMETSWGVPIKFCYSKNGRTPYDKRTDGEDVILSGGPGTLYPAEKPDIGQTLTWRDAGTGYAFWLVTELSREDMVRFAESVKIYLHNMDSLFTIDVANGLADAPLCQEVERILTEEFVEQVKAFARRDAAEEDFVYMPDDYRELVDGRKAECLSPERESAEAHVSALIEGFSGAEKQNSQHILCLVEPFYFANIYAGPYRIGAQLYNDDGVMIAGYTTDGWFDVPTYAEMQFQYTVTQIYYTAYREAKEN